MRKQKGAGFFLLMGFMALLFAPVVFAAVNIPPPNTGNVAGSTGVIGTIGDIATLFCGIINWIFWGLIVVAIVMFLLGGYRYATSGGDPEKVHGATKSLTFAVIGIVVALVAAGVPYLVGSFLQGSSFQTNSVSACPPGGSGGSGGGINPNFNLPGPSQA